jgi:hypothetical protein
VGVVWVWCGCGVGVVWVWCSQSFLFSQANTSQHNTQHNCVASRTPKTRKAYYTFPPSMHLVTLLLHQTTPSHPIPSHPTLLTRSQQLSRDVQEFEMLDEQHRQREQLAAERRGRFLHCWPPSIALLTRVRVRVRVRVGVRMTRMPLASFLDGSILFAV